MTGSPTIFTVNPPSGVFESLTAMFCAGTADELYTDDTDPALMVTVMPSYHGVPAVSACVDGDALPLPAGAVTPYPYVSPVM